MDRIKRWRWSVVGLAAGLPLAAVGLALAARVQPAFYRQAAVAPAAAAARSSGQPSAGRFVSKIAALGSDIARPGPWGAVLSDNEINSWLAIDLPRSHPDLLPGTVHDPRLHFADGKVLAGCRLGPGWLAATAWGEAEVRLVERNRLSIRVPRARVGLLPVPGGLVLARLARVCSAAGMACELRRSGGMTVLAASLPAAHDAGSTSHWLEGLRIDEGEVVIQGVTRAASTAGSTRP